MKKIISISICLLSLTFNLSSQITFQKTFEKDGGGNGFACLQTSDEGYIIGGYTATFGSSDAYLIKTDVNGDTSWTKTFGGSGADAGWSIDQTSDGGYIIAGYSNSFGAGNDDVYLIKTDMNGDTVWTKTYGGTNNERGNYIKQTSDGGYIITGYTESFGAGGQDLYVIKLGATGDSLWIKTFGGTMNDVGNSIIQTADGGYIVTGVSYSFGAGNGDVYLVKLDVNGDSLWTKAYGGTSLDYGYSVQQTSSGSYIVAGYTESFGAGNYDCYVFKIDVNGDTLWTKTYGGTSVDQGRDIQETSDNGFIVTGWTFSFGAGGADVFVIRTDTNGDTLWTKTIGGPLDDQARSVRETADDGYILTGGSASFGSSYNVYLIKIDGTNYVGCNQSSPTTIVGATLTQTSNTTTQLENTITSVASTGTIAASGAELMTVCESAGINSEKNVNFLSVFPNPSVGVFIVLFTSTIKNGQIEIINLLGENVYSENILNVSSASINIEGISPGIYFVRFSDGDQFYCTKIILE